MEILYRVLFLVWVATASVMAQMDVPGNPMVTPKKFKTRAVGGGVNTGATVDPATSSNTMIRYVSHIVLFDFRIWTSHEGKPLQAKLIAFEDLVAQAPKGSPAPAMPAPPALPTVIRSGKARLLANGKPVEISLDRLSQQDQEFIAGIQAALVKKASGR